MRSFPQSRAVAEAAVKAGHVRLEALDPDEPVPLTQQGDLGLYSDVRPFVHPLPVCCVWAPLCSLCSRTPARCTCVLEAVCGVCAREGCGRASASFGD